MPLRPAHLLVAAAIALGVLPLLVQRTESAFSSQAVNSANSFATAASFPSGGCPSMSPAFVTGMETSYVGTPGAFTTTAGVANVEQTVVRSGAYALRVSKGANSIAYARRSGFPLNGTSLVLHFAFRVGALPTADTTFAWLDGVGSDLLLKYKASTTRLALQLGTQTPVEADATLAPNTWYSIEIKADTSGNPVTAAWRINGTAQTPVSSAETGGYAYGNLYFGSTTTADPPAYTAYYDDIVYTKTLSDYPTGALKVDVLRPDSNGGHINPAQFRHNDDSAIDASTWSRLDNLPLAAGTDYVKQVAAGTSSYLEFGFTNPGQSCIFGVQGHVAVGSLGTAGNSVKMSVFDDTAESVIHNGATTCSNCTTPKSAMLAPKSAPWTRSAVDGLILRLGHQRDATPVTYWRHAMLEYVTTY